MWIFIAIVVYFGVGLLALRLLEIGLSSPKWFERDESSA